MGQRKRKKSKRGSSSSETEEVMTASASNGGDSMYNELKNSKLDFMQSTELARRSMADADQLLQDLSAGKTERKFGQ